MSNTAKNYIGGEWIEPVDTAPSINPSDVSDIVGEFARGSEKDVDLAAGLREEVAAPRPQGGTREKREPEERDDS